jgi:hypothetical protein
VVVGDLKAACVAAVAARTSPLQVHQEGDNTAINDT